jgi:hypothetical protein
VHPRHDKIKETVNFAIEVFTGGCPACQSQYKRGEHSRQA